MLLSLPEIWHALRIILAGMNSLTISVSKRVSGWDVEWFYHLPFPFASVEWFDIALYETIPAEGRLLKPRVIDHTKDISNAVQAIGFEFEVRGDVLRIWGYLPKSYEDFPPA